MRTKLSLHSSIVYKSYLNCLTRLELVLPCQHNRAGSGSFAKRHLHVQYVTERSYGLT